MHSCERLLVFGLFWGTAPSHVGSVVESIIQCCASVHTAVSGSMSGVSDEKTAAPVVVKGWQPPTLQPAFQSTSTPVSLSARFMVGYYEGH